MSTKIQPGGPSSGVSSTPTASRVTAPPARPFKQVMTAGAGAIIDGAEAAMQRLPGGPVLAAAVRPGTGGSHVPAGATPEGSGGTAGAPGGTGDGAGGEQSMEQVMSQNADKNMYYLQLQERISAESRAYTALSNVLKARHDTIKNAIGNIR